MTELRLQQNRRGELDRLTVCQCGPVRRGIVLLILDDPGGVATKAAR